MNPEVQKILVTGATGFLGRRLIQKLAERGHRVRALSRRPPSAERGIPAGVETVCADVADAVSLKPAFQDIDIVVHAAADTGGSEEGAKRSTIQGTQNVIELCGEFRVKKLVYISTLNVYGVAGLRENSVADENAPLEPYPERRGFYTWGKLAAEKIVLKAMMENHVPIVCLRPGTILGPGGEVFTPMMGFSAGKALFLVIGKGGFALPLVYLDNLVDAVAAVIASAKAGGQVFNVVEPDALGKKEYAERLLKILYPKAVFISMPYGSIYLAVWLAENLMKLMGKKPFFTRYRLISSQRNIIYDSSWIRRHLNWSPPFTMDDAFTAIIGHSRQAARKG